MARGKKPESTPSPIRQQDGTPGLQRADIDAAVAGALAAAEAYADGLALLSEQVANKGQPNGYASLDAGGLVPAAQLPAPTPPVLATTDLTDVVSDDTLVPTDGSGAGLVFPSVYFLYVRHGGTFTFLLQITYPVTADVSPAVIDLSMLPFITNFYGMFMLAGAVALLSTAVTWAGTSMNFIDPATTNPITNNQLSGGAVNISGAGVVL